MTAADVYLAPTPPACCTSGLPPTTWDSNVTGETPTAKKHRIATARGICTTCPLRPDCTELGGTNNELGVWGDWFADNDRATRPLRYPTGLGLHGWGTQDRRAS